MLYCPKQEQWEGSRVSVVVQTDKLKLGEPSVDMGSGPSLGFLLPFKSKSRVRSLLLQAWRLNLEK